MRRTLLALTFGMLSSLSQADDLPHGVHMDARWSALPPASWDRFCRLYAEQCDTPADKNREIKLTPDTWAVISRVNKRVNDSMSYITDSRHWGVDEQWDLPVDGKGDCEDWAAEKRRLLINSGFPKRALLLTIVTFRGSGHAVLTIITDHGDFILDDMYDIPQTTDRFDYIWTQRQDPELLRRWTRYYR